PQEARGLEHRADDRIHPPRLLGDVEHDGGHRFGPGVEDGPNLDVEAPVLCRQPPDRPEDRDDRQDRTEQRGPNEELDDDEDERTDGQLLRADSALLEDEVVAAMDARAVDDERPDQQPDNGKEECALDEQQDHPIESKVAAGWASTSSRPTPVTSTATLCGASFTTRRTGPWVFRARSSNGRSTDRSAFQGSTATPITARRKSRSRGS